MSNQTQSPSINFRELDDEYLQNQAKEWLETILGDKLEDQLLAEALANGDILHRVSKLLKEQLKHFGEDMATTKISSWEADFEARKSGKYLPYSNVDSFLKVCKRFSLPDIDLFSPPDVVEKKDIRKVCLCIRALSKKARVKRMRIPDFDNVSGTMAILHEKVGDVGPVGQNGNNFINKDASFTFESKLDSEACSWELSSVSSRESTASSTPLDTQSSYLGGNRESPSTQAMDTEVCSRIKDRVYRSEDQPYHSASSQVLQSEKLPSPFGQDQNIPVHALASQQDLDNLESTCFPVSSTDESGSSSSTDVQQHHTSTMKKQDKNLSGTRHINGDVRKARKFRLWVPVFAGAVTLIGIILTRRLRERETYEVKEGDTLSEICRKTGKGDWQKLVEINPGIKDPDLIYPSERLRLNG